MEEFVLLSLFFTSGAVALSAEVVLERLLTYIFGATYLATATVLAAYMAGLTLGSILVGRLTSRFKRPIAVYAYFEMAVGLFLACIPMAFEWTRGAGLALVRTWSEHDVLLGLVRFAFAFLFVLIPTVLMGGTLPLLVFAAREDEPLESRLPRLYAVNTLGAAAGTLLAAYVLVPRLGLDGTLFAGALTNACIGLAALLLASRNNSPRADTAELQTPSRPTKEGIEPRLVCVLAFAQGAIAFVLEVTWAHLIGTVIGVTVYAFGLMLAAILLSIAAGSLLAPALVRRGFRPLTIFIAGQLVAAVGVVSSLYGWDRFPQLVATTLWLSPHWSFAARETLRFAFTLVLLLPTMLGLGAALPMLAAAAKSGEREGHREGAWVGLVFGTNTLGAITGSLAAGFLLLGRVSSDRILIGAGASALLLSIVAAVAGRHSGAIAWNRRSVALVAVTSLAMAALAVGFPGWDGARLTSGSHYYWTAPVSPARAILFMREDAQSGFVTVKRNVEGTRIIETNGKYEGSSSPLEFQDHVASLGALYLRNTRRTLLVGLGPGRTLALLHDLPFEKIEIVEYSRTIVEAARLHFAEFTNPSLNDLRRVSLHLDDGRGHLQSSSERYDYVAIAITGAAFAGAGSLYTSEFFQTVRDRLQTDGVFILWVQLHHVRPRDVRSVVLTLSRVFPHVHMYATPDGTQGYLISSSEPLKIDPRAVARFEQAPRIRSIMAMTRMRSLLELTALNVFSTREEIDAYGAGVGETGPRPVEFTDFFPGLEYGTPYGLAEPNADHRLQLLSRRVLPEFEPDVGETERARLLSLRRQVVALSLASPPR